MQGRTVGYKRIDRRRTGAWTRYPRTIRRMEEGDNMSAKPARPARPKKSTFKLKPLVTGRYLGERDVAGIYHDVSVFKNRYVAVIGKGLSRTGFFKKQRIDILRPLDGKGKIRIVGRFTIGGLHECSEDAPEELRRAVLSQMKLVQCIADSASHAKLLRQCARA